jgi:hypothetical protein
MNFLALSLNCWPDSVIPELTSNLRKKESLSIESLADNKTYETLYIPEDKNNLLNNFCPLVLNKYQPIAIASHTLALK